MNFKYVRHHQRLQVECPPRTSKPMQLVGFRWFFEKGDKRNFQTQYEKFVDSPNPPKRYNDDSDLLRRDTKFCEDMAYSMYVSEQKAKEGFSFFLERHKKKAFEKFGRFIACGELTESDGVNSQTDPNGHFNHHPCETTDYENRFQIVSNLEELWKN